MRGLALSALAALVACGPPGAPRNPDNAATGSDGAAASPAMRTHLCQRVRALQGAHCSPFDKMDPALLADCSVVDSLYISSTQTCMDQPTCDGVQSCMQEIARSGAPYSGPTLACTGPNTAGSTIPAGLSTREVEASYGRTDAAFGDSPSSVKRPIEVCGMPEETGYLTRVTCADGSHPFGDRGAADNARSGSVGTGGRCNRTIDRYVVACPEHEYEVFIDAYRCPAHAD